MNMLAGFGLPALRALGRRHDPSGTKHWVSRREHVAGARVDELLSIGCEPRVLPARTSGRQLNGVRIAIGSPFENLERTPHGPVRNEDDALAIRLPRDFSIHHLAIAG